MSSCRWDPVTTIFPNPFRIAWCVGEVVFGEGEEESPVQEAAKFVPEMGSVVNQQVEEGGFRLVENHFQGMGIGAILMAACLAVILAIYCYCTKRRRSSGGKGGENATTIVINNDEEAPNSPTNTPGACRPACWTCPAGPAPCQQQQLQMQQLVAPPPTPVGGERERRSPTPSRLPRRSERESSVTTVASGWSVMGLPDAWGTTTREGRCSESRSRGGSSCVTWTESERGWVDGEGTRARERRRQRRRRRARKDEAERKHAGSTPGERYYDYTIAKERARQHALVTRAAYHAGESRWQALKELEELREKRLLMVAYPPPGGDSGAAAEERACVRAVEKERARQEGLVHAARYGRKGERRQRAREALDRLKEDGQLLVCWPGREEEKRAHEALASTYGEEAAEEIAGRVADAGLGLSVEGDATGQ